MFITKKLTDHIKKTSETCGEISEVLTRGEYAHLDVAVICGITHTVAHYHASFDEVYLVASGALTVEFYDPARQHKWAETYHSDELCVIGKGLHHKVVGGTAQNKLIVICVPGFDLADEHISEVLESAG